MNNKAVKLYKDSSEVRNETQYESEAEMFYSRIEDGTSLRECLNIPEKLVINEKGQDGWKHKKCNCKNNNGNKGMNVEKTTKDANKEPTNTEKRILRCFYYRDGKYTDRKCLGELCKIYLWNVKKKNILYGCTILDYEVPVKYKKEKVKSKKDNKIKKKESGIGNFDLLIKYENKNYAIEVKPPKNTNDNKENKESIFRMILEILTYDYCNCYDEKNPNKYNHNKAKIYNKNDDILNKNNGIYYELGIAFFKESKQDEQFNFHKGKFEKDKEDVIIKILKKYKITVFIISEFKDGYKIDKIYN